MDMTVRVENIREFTKLVKEIQPDLMKQMRKDLNTTVKPTAQAIANAIPDPALKMRGVASNKTGRSRWSKPSARVSFTPGSYSKGSDEHPLVSISLASSDDAVLFHMGELAGLRNDHRARSRSFIHWRSGSAVTYANNGQGISFIRTIRTTWNVSSKAGTWAWPEFVKHYPEVSAAALDVIESYVTKLNGMD